MTVWLTPHFALEEMIATSHRGIDNHPPPSVLAALTDTAARMEVVRKLLGDRVISVSSGYRSPALNVEVGGSKTSAHLVGRAVDFRCYSFGSPLAVCRRLAETDLEFDQMIEEGTWVHISFDPRMRREILTKAGAGYRPGLRDGP